MWSSSINRKEKQFKKTEEELRNRDEEFHAKIRQYFTTSFQKKKKDDQNFSLSKIEQTSNKKKLEDNILALKEKNSTLNDNLEKLVKIHDSLKKYENFLNSVKEKHSDNFSDIQDIINKYKTLDSNYKKLKEEEENIKREKEEEEKRFKKEKSEYESRINGIISDIQLTQEKIKTKKDKRKVLESEVSQFESNSNSVVSSLEKILLAVENIHKKCKDKKEWTKHEIDHNERVDRNDYKMRGLFLISKSIEGNA